MIFDVASNRPGALVKINEAGVVELDLSGHVKGQKAKSLKLKKSKPKPVKKTSYGSGSSKKAAVKKFTSAKTTKKAKQVDAKAKAKPSTKKAKKVDAKANAKPAKKGRRLLFQPPPL